MRCGRASASVNSLETKRNFIEWNFCYFESKLKFILFAWGTGVFTIDFIMDVIEYVWGH